MSASDHHEEWGDEPTIPFSSHVLSEITTVVLLLALYTVLAIFIPGHLDIKADPAITPVGSKPEWYFLFLFAILHYVSPLVGTVMPAVGLVLLAALPWIDRNPERHPSKRKVAITGAILLMVGIVYLSYLGANAGH